MTGCCFGGRHHGTAQAFLSRLVTISHRRVGCRLPWQVSRRFRNSLLQSHETEPLHQTDDNNNNIDTNEQRASVSHHYLSPSGADAVKHHIMPWPLVLVSSRCAKSATMTSFSFSLCFSRGFRTNAVTCVHWLLSRSCDNTYTHTHTQREREISFHTII